VLCVHNFQPVKSVIDAVDSELTSWADRILGKKMSSLAAPGIKPSARGVSLFLIDIISAPPPRTARKVRLEISLRYLVTSWSEDIDDAHKLIGDLLFAAMENSNFTVETGPVPIEVWQCLGVPPRPGFLLRVPLSKELPERPVKYVRRLVLQTAPSTSLQGLVTGPGDIAISGALVELPSMNLTARTDPRGGFHFPNIAAEPSDQVLRVRAKGREQTFRTAENKRPDGIVHIHFQLEED
jgi:hypothetical protein